ncbi:MAG: SH3 domain-containing protein [Oligoflexales bacterium]
MKSKILVLAGVMGLWNCSGDKAMTEEPVNNVTMEAPAETSQPGAGMHADAQVQWVNVSALNVREGAGMSHGVTRHVREGEQVKVHERVGVWAKIGQGEWVSSRYLRDQP